MLLSENVAEYARTLAQECEIDSTCVMIADKTTPLTQLYFLGNFGVCEEVLDLYNRFRICDCDPFTDVLVNEHYADTGFRALNDPRVARCGSRSESYYDFVLQKHVDVVGAATMRLQSRLYLTIGTHRSATKQHTNKVPMERLAYGIEILQNKIAANLLASILAGGKGYRTLLETVNKKSDGANAATAELSARETEIARLVCEGRQNKEIAYMTGLSECTIENHLRRIYQKFRIHNRAALVAHMNGVFA